MKAEKIVTEKVSENYQPRPGRMSSRTFWVAYPESVGALGHMSDRVSRAVGRGDTEAEALAAARAQ